MALSHQRNNNCNLSDTDSEDHDPEIIDYLAQPLIAEGTISSPSLFDETPTNSLSSHSSPLTVQNLY